MLSMEPFGWKLMVDYSGGPDNLSTQRQRTVGPLKLLFFWWRLIDELMNVVQVLEAFFDFQDLKQSCW